MAPDLLTLVTAVAGRWAWRAEVLLPVGVLAALYVRGWRRLRLVPRARRIASGWRLASYLGGLGCIVLALCSPIEYLAELSFTAHMIQHQLLIMGAAPLLLLGEPFPLMVWALPMRLRRRLGGLLVRPGPLRRILRALTWMPAAGVLSAAALWGWHHPAAYEAALRHPALHDLEHLSFLATAVLFWWPVVNPAPRLRRLCGGTMYGARIAYLILSTGQTILLGAVLGLAERALYPSYAAAPRLLVDWSPVDDQAFGGGVMWSGAHMFLLAVLVLLHRAMGPSGQNEGAQPRTVV
jgi:cytochrome c oxidase assembly factor CtaG